MNTWFTKNLGDALLAGKALDDITMLFQSEYSHTTQPKDMAIFIRHESDGRLQCEVCLYFSPAAAAVARAVAAVTCNKPSAEDLGLFAGPETAWSHLFPEKFR